MVKIIAITILTLAIHSYMLANGTNGSENLYVVEVDAGNHNRVNTVVTLQVPATFSQGVYLLEGDGGVRLPLQVDDKGLGWFVLPELNANSRAVLSVVPTPTVETSFPLVNLNIDSSTVELTAGGNKVLNFYHGLNTPPEGLDQRYQRGGYIHPVYSPSGVVITNHLNVEQHPHHAGIWSAWATTQFQGRTPDFWNIHSNSGRVDTVEGSFESWEGPVFGGFKAENQFIDLGAPDPIVALNEEWDVRVYNLGGAINLFDLTVKQISTDTLYLPEYRYGGIGFRGNVEWDDSENCTFLTSEGAGREGHASRPKWVRIDGSIEGQKVGVVIMDSPSNFRFPQPVRIHPTEPFFNFAPQQLGDMAIAPSEPYTARYRYITFDGNLEPNRIEQLWNDYADPPVVRMGVME